MSIREKVVALPDIQVGSIIEYRYKLRQSVTYGIFYYTFISTWYTQSEHFERKEHFVWHSSLSRIAWTSTLPAGSAAVKADKSFGFTLDVENVMPISDEPSMLPKAYFVQKVDFYRVSNSIRSIDDFWTQEGKIWNKGIDDFIGPAAHLTDLAMQMTAAANTQDEKLRKIYAVLQQMENIDFSRQHSAREEKRDGELEPKSVVDVLKRKRGDDLQLTYLFVALARAVGMKAYIMAVTNRDINVFNDSLLSFHQLNDDVAIVEVDGHERFFDPAEPFCPYGQLLWTHNSARGVRQTENGIAIVASQDANFKETQTRRSATLTLTRDGHESGTAELSFTGATAMGWRQSTLLDDETALHKTLESTLSDMLPSGTEVTFHSIDNLRDENQPLLVHFEISGPWANLTGKRMVLSSQFFQIRQQELFTSSTRKTPVYFYYPERITDGVTLRVPDGWQVESQPTAATESMPQIAALKSNITQTAQQLIFQRDYVFAGMVIPVNLYSEMRDFFTRVAARDRAPVVLRLVDAAAGSR
jgi:hypothetical protein